MEIDKEDMIKELSDFFLGVRKELDKQIYSIFALFFGGSLFSLNFPIDFFKENSSISVLIFINFSLVVIIFILTILANLSSLEQTKQDFLSHYTKDLAHEIQKIMKKTENFNKAFEYLSFLFLLFLTITVGLILKIKCCIILAAVIFIFLTIILGLIYIYLMPRP